MIKENFVEYIENSLKGNWELSALSDYQGVTHTFGEIAKQISKLHIIFDKCGVNKGDKISLLGKNSSNWAISYLATVCYGAVIVPILSDFHANDIHHIINHSDSVLLIAGDQLWENLDESIIPDVMLVLSLTDFKVLSSKCEKESKKAIDNIDELYFEKFEGGITAEKVRFDHVSNESVGVLNYTSGTTGFSKGVILPLNSLAANVRFARNNLPLSPGNHVVSFLPLAHTYGCAFEFLWPFSIGCHIHFLTKTPSPKIIIKAFEEIKPHVVLAVPLIIEKIYKKQLLPILNKKSMKILLSLPLVDKSIYSKINKKLTDVFGGRFKEIIIGGAALNKDVEDFLRKIGFRFTIGYGMTECGPLISYSSWDKAKYLSSGKMVDSLTVKIDSEDPYNTVGEIMVKGENVMQGYYKNPEATKQAIDDEGWLHTGDLGIIDKEDYVFIKGRNKSLILGPSGENIYPEEVEAKLNNMRYVQESVVVDKNFKLIALVYPDYELVDQEGINEKQLQEILEKVKVEVNSTLPKFSQLSRIKIFPTEFEKTPKKSIKRFLYTVED